MRNTLQFMKKAVTRGTTDISGSSTFYFKDGHIYTYNNIVAIKGKTEVDISGSINADTFYRLLETISVDTTITDDKQSIIVSYGKNKSKFTTDDKQSIIGSYGKNKSKFTKEVDGLERYVDVIFGNVGEQKPIPDNFLKAMTVSNFQQNANRISGICIDDNKFYAINKGDIAEYTIEKGVGDMYWIPFEGVELIKSIPETITHFSASSSFFYLHTDSYTIAIKLLFADKFPLKIAINAIKAYGTPTNSIVIPQIIETTLKRIKLASSKTKVNGEMLCKITTDTSLIVESMHNNEMNVTEYLEYTNNNVPKLTIEVPIDNLLALLKESFTLYVIEEETVVSLIVKTDEHIHILRTARE